VYFDRRDVFVGFGDLANFALFLVIKYIILLSHCFNVYSDILQNVGGFLQTLYNKNMKDSRKLERVFKGAANHWRIEILVLIKKNPEITLIEIADKLKANFKTVSEHTKKLVAAGLVNKKYLGRSVNHVLSPYGEKMLEILKHF